MNTKESKKIVVFGGSGFLGSHVADQLSESGYDVVIFDVCSSPWLRKDQTFIKGDLLDKAKVNDVIQDAHAVYNFAALADLNEALDKPLRTVEINILGNVHILEACKNQNVLRMVYASTVYVQSRDGGFYKCSKQAAENYVEEYNRSFGLDYTILRYGSLYGPRATLNNGLLRIVKNALETGVVRYEGSSDTFREYIHVEDAAKASVVALGEDFKNQTIVLTGQEPMRVYDLLKMLAEILGIPNAVEFKENEYPGHYVRTPYAFQPKPGRKYIPPMHVDLGQGLLQVIGEISSVNENVLEKFKSFN